MPFDITLLLRRIAVASLPFSPACSLLGCRPCDIEHSITFDMTISGLGSHYVLLSSEETHDNGGNMRRISRWPGDAAAPLDGAASDHDAGIVADAATKSTDGGAGRERRLTPAAQKLFEACVATPPRCRSFCDELMRDFFQEASVKMCQATRTGAGADVRITGTATTQVCGRRPEGLLQPGSSVATPLGTFLAHAAHLEAASVPAFRRLAVDLTAHAAPAGLIASARQAARDEARHARIVGSLARAAGACSPRVRLAPHRPVSLFELAEANVVEGCVRESFGAAVAYRQAATAASPSVRRAMSTISRDELAHARLAWRIDAWVRTRLPRVERLRLRGARDRAIAELHEASGHEQGREVARVLGLPDRRCARSMVDQLATGIG